MKTCVTRSLAIISVPAVTVAVRYGRRSADLPYSCATTE